MTVRVFFSTARLFYFKRTSQIPLTSYLKRITCHHFISIQIIAIGVRVAPSARTFHRFLLYTSGSVLHLSMLLLLMTADDEVVIITIGYDLVGYDDNGGTRTATVAPFGASWNLGHELAAGHRPRIKVVKLLLGNAQKTHKSLLPTSTGPNRLFLHRN